MRTTIRTTSLALAAMLAGCLAGCNRPAAGAAKPAASPAQSAKPVPIHVVKNEVHKKNITVPATIEGYFRAELMAKVDGYVKDVGVNIGSEVAPRQVLAQLDLPEFAHELERRRQMLAQVQADQAVRAGEVKAAQAQLNEQHALVDLRKSEMNRVVQLVREGALSKQKQLEAQFSLASARTAVASYQHNVQVAQARLGMAQKQIQVAIADVDKTKSLGRYREIAAPFAGVITRRNVDPGAYVRPASAGGSSKPLLVVESVDKLRAVVYLATDQAGALDVGDDAVLTKVLDAPGRKFTAKISRAANAFDRGSRMMRAEIDIINAPEGPQKKRPLRPGGYGVATITLDVKKLPTVPKDALIRVKGRDYVMRVDADGTCREDAGARVGH